MREYGKVYTAFWTSEDIRALTEDARTLAIYLLTCEHGNMLGCFRLTNAYAADDLQWDIERISKGFTELHEKGFIYRCNKTFWTFVCEFLKWNQFENPNVGKAAGKLFISISAPAELKALLFKALQQYSPNFPSNVLDEFEEKNKPFPNPSETVSKTRASTGATTSAVTSAKPEPNQFVGQNSPDLIVQDIFAYWQKVMNSPKSKLDDKRKKVIEKALKHHDAHTIGKAIRGCSKSPFNMGQNDRNTKFNSIGLILRDADQIDRFVMLDDNQAIPENETLEQRNARILAEVMNGVDLDDPNVIDMED